METITEIRTQPKKDKNLLDAYGVVDLISTTSDLSSSAASSTRSESILVSAHDSALLSGKMLPLQAMKSLLRISASDSYSDELSTELEEEESPLFGEIWDFIEPGSIRFDCTYWRIEKLPSGIS